MASSYNSIRCDCCAGTLEYIKEKKVWRCLYCGNEMLRESLQGPDTPLKNVARQAIRNAAVGNLSEALNNLSECEKKDGRYVGTLIARLCVHMFTLITPGGCPDGARNSLTSQLKREYAAILEVDEAISPEEEDLYDFMDGDGSLESSSEPFAALLLTFDAMGDTVHRDFVAQFLKVEAIYHRTLNAHLLRYALYNGQLDMARGILGNTDNLDCKDALLQMLSQFPDAADKGALAQALIQRAGLTGDDHILLEDYLSRTGDSLSTRQEVYCAAARAGVPVSMEVISRFVLDEGGEPAKAAEIVAALCAQKPPDVELYCLIEQIFCRHSAPLARAELEVIAASGLFVSVPVPFLCTMLDRSDLAGADKIALFAAADGFGLDQRAKDAVLSHYLSENRDEPAVRLEVLPALLDRVKTLSTGAVEQYLLTCTTDGDQKPQVVALLLGLELNLSFFRPLLGKYYRGAPDSPPVREAVLSQLREAGFQMDGASLMDLIGEAAPEEMERTVSFVQQMAQSGVRLPGDALSRYLEGAGQGPFHPQMLALLSQSATMISPQALANYVLFGPDDPEAKVNGARFLAQCSGQPLGATPCRVLHLGNQIQCNLFQGYVLTTQDSGATAQQMTDAMAAGHVSLKPAIAVNGVSMSFKSYIQHNRAALNPVTEALCDAHGVFRLFF